MAVHHPHPFPLPLTTIGRPIHLTSIPISAQYFIRSTDPASHSFMCQGSLGAFTAVFMADSAIAADLTGLIFPGKEKEGKSGASKEGQAEQREGINKPTGALIEIAHSQGTEEAAKIA